MAPVDSPFPVDLRDQIKENCEFLSDEEWTKIGVVIAKEPLGTFTAIALSIDDGKRKVLFSETAPTVLDALQALLLKSAEAVQNYIATNGFKDPAKLKGRKSKRSTRHDDGTDSDSDSSTLTLDDCVTISDDDDDDDDDDTISVTSVDKAKKRSRRKASKNVKSKTRKGRSRSRSPSTSSSDSEIVDEDGPPITFHRRPPIHGATRPMPPRPLHHGIPFTAVAQPPRHPYARGPQPFVPNNHPSPAGPFINTAPLSKTPYGPISVQPHTPAAHDVILHINWHPHGTRRVLEHITGSLSPRALQQAALGYVRRNANIGGSGFTTAPDTIPAGLPPHLYQQRLRATSNMRARVKRIVVDGVAYDMPPAMPPPPPHLRGSHPGAAGEGATGDGRDLAGLVAALGADSKEEGGVGNGNGGLVVVPRFEIDVWHVIGGFGDASGGAAPGSVAGWMSGETVTTSKRPASASPGGSVGVPARGIDTEPGMAFQSLPIDGCIE